MENSVMMRDPRKSNYYYEESIKTLRTNIQFSSKQVKTILLTSCYPNEGKSDVAFSLAMEMGKLGQKVLLIDADIRKSNDHHPLRAKTINNDGTLEMYEKNSSGKVSTNRQDLPSCLFLSHNFWVLRVDYLKSGKEGQQPWGFMGDKIVPYEIDESIDIHKDVDLLIAKNWIENNYND